MSDDPSPTGEGLQLVKDLCRQIAQQPGTLSMIRATRDWPRLGIHVGAYVIFEERPVAPSGEDPRLNGRLAVVARLAGRNYHYIGHARRVSHRQGVSIRLDDGVLVPQCSFVLRGSVVLIAQTTRNEAFEHRR